jgi:hypothetical protein
MSVATHDNPENGWEVPGADRRVAGGDCGSLQLAHDCEAKRGGGEELLRYLAGKRS